MPPSSHFIELPQQAVPHNESPHYYAIHSGIATGVYSHHQWAEIDPLVQSRVARTLRPQFRRCDTWNQAVWYAKNGVVLPAPGLQIKPMARPVRQVQPLEILSEVYPPGSTLLLEDDDEIMAYRGPDAPIKISVVRKAAGSLASTFYRVLPLSHLDHLALSQPVHSTQLTTLPPSISSSRAVQSSSELTMRELLTQVDTQPMAAATRSLRSVPARRANSDAGSNVVQPASPPPTLVDPNSRPTTPSGSTQSHSDASWIYERSTFAAPPTIRGSPSCSPELAANDHAESQGASSQASSSQQRGLPPGVVTEARRRLRALRDMRDPDSQREAQISGYMIVRLLETTTLTAEGIQEVQDAALGLSG